MYVFFVFLKKNIFQVIQIIFQVNHLLCVFSTGFLLHPTKKICLNARKATGFHRKVLTLDKISDLSRSTAGMKVNFPADIREERMDEELFNVGG